MCDRVVELGAQGCSITEMAADLGVSRETVYAWSREKADFSDALLRARTLSQSWWERQAREGLVSANGVSINAGLWKAYMAARFPHDYTEKRDITSSDGSLAPPTRIEIVAAPFPDDNGTD